MHATCMTDMHLTTHGVIHLHGGTCHIVHLQATEVRVVRISRTLTELGRPQRYWAHHPDARKGRVPVSTHVRVCKCKCKQFTSHIQIGL